MSIDDTPLARGSAVACQRAGVRLHLHHIAAGLDHDNPDWAALAWLHATAVGVECAVPAFVIRAQVTPAVSADALTRCKMKLHWRITRGSDAPLERLSGRASWHKAKHGKRCERGRSPLPATSRP